jgi:hypothetical protein
MSPSQRLHGVRSWLGAALLCVITLWVTVFYVIEAHRIATSKYVSDYKIYYSIADEGN